MKKIRLFLSLLLITLSFTNCSNEDFNNESTEANSTDLSGIHSQMKQKFENFSLASTTQKSLYGKNDENKLKAYIDEVFIVNYDYAIANGVEKLFSEYGLNSNLIDVAEWAIQNINDEDLYSKLYSKYSIDNESDANLLFYYIEVYKQFELNNSLFGKSLQAKGSGCGRAVVGTLVATAIFAGVVIGSGGVGLPAALGFLAAKGWATYNIAAACSEAQVLQERLEAPFLEEDLIPIKDQKDINIELPLI